jgi:hypothetical protein
MIQHPKRNLQWWIRYKGHDQFIHPDVRVFHKITFDDTALAESNFDFRNCEFHGCIFPISKNVVRFTLCMCNDCVFSGGRTEKEMSVTFQYCYLKDVEFNDLFFNDALFYDCKLDKALIGYNVLYRFIRFQLTSGIETCYSMERLRSSSSTSSELDRDIQIAPVPFTEKYISWERLKTVGQLPFFSVSLFVLIATPAFFFAIAAYNNQIQRLKDALGDDAKPHMLYSIFDRINLAPIPSNSLLLIIFTLFIFAGATAYTFGCPKRVKQYSLEQWLHELRQPALDYLPQSWSLRWLRIPTVLCYAIGGLGNLYVLGDKLRSTVLFISHNTTLPWWSM